MDPTTESTSEYDVESDNGTVRTWQKKKHTPKVHSQPIDAMKSSHPKVHSQLDGLRILLFGTFPNTNHAKIQQRVRAMCGVIIDSKQYLSEHAPKVDIVILGNWVGGKSDVLSKVIEQNVLTTNIKWLKFQEDNPKFVKPRGLTKWKIDYNERWDNNKTGNKNPKPTAEQIKSVL